MKLILDTAQMFMKIKLGNREGVSEDEIFVLGINNE